MILIMTFQDLSRIVFKVIVCQEKGFFRDHLLKLCVVFILITSLIVANFSDSQKYHEPQNSLMSFQETFQFNDHPKNLNNTIYNFKDGKKPKWNLPHFVWIFRNLNEEIIENFNTFRHLNVLNTKHFAEQGNYSIKQINYENYHQHLSNKSSQKVSFVIKFLEERLKDEKNQNSHKQISENKDLIIKRLIIYLVLLEKGGIFVDQMTTVVEGFDTWIEDIMNVVDINLGDRNDPNFKPKCFGFYNKEFSSLRMKVDVKREFEFEKKMVVFPSLEDDLIACEEQTEFMTKLVESYFEILTSQDKPLWVQKLNTNKTLIGRTNTSLPYKYGHILALHSILQQRQHFLNQHSNNQYKNLAIDNFGFVTINANIALRKFDYSLGIDRGLFAFLAKLQIKYFSVLNGKLRFAHKLHQNITAYFTQQLNSELNPPEFFLQNSFIHTFLLRFWPKGQKFKDYRYVIPINDQRLRSKKQMIELSEPQIMPQLIESENNENNPQWQSFEKNLWVIWDKGLKGNSNLIAELCFQNLKKSADNSGYKLNFVTESNLDEFLDEQTLQKIHYTVKKAQYRITKAAESDLWRLALLYKYGGVYIDITTFMIEENLDFVQNITRIPSGLIWNRYGSHPKNLMFWQSHLGHPSDWQNDYKHSTKSQWQLGYENFFIAAEKNSEFIKEWFEVYLQWIVKDYYEIEKQMKSVGMWEWRWTKWWSRYLLAMDAAKYVLGRRQQLLKSSSTTAITSSYKSSGDYYKLWSTAGNMNGLQKLSFVTNYENYDYRLTSQTVLSDNIYKHQYSIQHASQILGPLSIGLKLLGGQTRLTNMMLEEFAIKKNFSINNNGSQFDEIVHPESMLSILLNMNITKTIQLTNYYAKLRSVRMKVRSKNIVGCSI